MYSNAEYLVLQSECMALYIRVLPSVLVICDIVHKGTFLPCIIVIAIFGIIYILRLLSNTHVHVTTSLLDQMSRPIEEKLQESAMLVMENK